MEPDGETIVLTGNESSVNLTDQSEPVDALPAEESEQT